MITLWFFSSNIAIHDLLLQTDDFPLLRFGLKNRRQIQNPNCLLVKTPCSPHVDAQIPICSATHLVTLPRDSLHQMPNLQQSGPILQGTLVYNPWFGW